MAPPTVIIGGLKFSGIDYKKFKLFLLSTLWIMSISKLIEFYAVQVGPKHEENLRLMLLAENPGKAHEYGCWIRHIHPDRFPEDPREFAIMPMANATKVDGHPGYHFLIGGFIWTYFVSSHSEQFPHRERFLTENGELPVYHISKQEIDKFMSQAIRRIRIT